MIGSVEVVSIVPKTIFLLAAAWCGWFDSYGLLVFGAAQLIYSLALMAIFWALSPLKALAMSSWQAEGERCWVDGVSRRALG